MAMGLLPRIGYNKFPVRIFTHIYIHLPPPQWQWAIWHGLVVINASIADSIHFDIFLHTFMHIYLFTVAMVTLARIGCNRFFKISV